MWLFGAAAFTRQQIDFPAIGFRQLAGDGEAQAAAAGGDAA